MKTIFNLIVATLLAACGDKVSFDTLELQRAIANDNSAYNAKKWRADNGFGDLGILPRGDSTQQANCAQGDGWASVDLASKPRDQWIGLAASAEERDVDAL